MHRVQTQEPENKNAEEEPEQIQVTPKGRPIRIMTDYDVEAFKAEGLERCIPNFERLQLSTRILCPLKLSFISEEEIKTSHDKEQITHS